MPASRRRRRSPGTSTPTAGLPTSAPPWTSFAMQSNGIAIDARWTEFFRRTGTNVRVCSIDGPEKFHDQRRRTRNGKPTWSLAMRALGRLQAAGLDPSVITVLHRRPRIADEYYAFYRDHGITQISFSVDEREGANRPRLWRRRPQACGVGHFIRGIMDSAFREGFPLHIREVQRVAQVLAGLAERQRAGRALGRRLSSRPTAAYRPFAGFTSVGGARRVWRLCLWQYSRRRLDDFADGAFTRCAREVAAGVDACRSACAVRRLRRRLAG